jgi:predicted transcriptional regulator
MAVTSLRIPPDLMGSLDSMAHELQRSKSWVINQALREYIERKEVEKYRWVETLEALDSVKYGKLVDGEKVNSWLESWGTDSEMEPPKS